MVLGAPCGCWGGGCRAARDGPTRGAHNGRGGPGRDGETLWGLAARVAGVLQQSLWLREGPLLLLEWLRWGRLLR